MQIPEAWQNARPQYKKPFDMIVKGLRTGNWLPGQHSLRFAQDMLIYSFMILKAPSIQTYPQTRELLFLLGTSASLVPRVSVLPRRSDIPRNRRVLSADPIE